MTTSSNPEAIVTGLPKQRVCSDPQFLDTTRNNFVEHLGYVRTTVDYEASRDARPELIRELNEIVIRTTVESAEAECSGTCSQCPRYLRYCEGGAQVLDLLRSHDLELPLTLPE